MPKTEYACQCYDNYHDVTYGAEFDTLSEAEAQVEKYRELIRVNGEQSQHSCIEVVKYQVDDDDEVIDGTEKTIKRFNI